MGGMNTITDHPGLYGISIKGGDNWHACNCIGPRNGEPLCPCMMRGVKIVNGRYVKTTDLGPAPSKREGS